MPFTFRCKKKKKNSYTPIDLKVYTLINNVPSETK